MDVTVQFHEWAEESYREWWHRLSQPPTGSADMASLHQRELIAEFMRCDGLPPAAKWVDDNEWSRWVWRFAADTWVEFVIHDVPAAWWQKLFGTPKRRVIITSISASRPI